MSKSKSASRREARNLWETHFKEKIPKGLHLHHIDGNPFNNDINNLQVCTPEEHVELHRLAGDKIQPNFIAKADWYDYASKRVKLKHKEASKRGGKKGGKAKPSEETKLILQKVQKIIHPIEMIELKTGKLLKEFPSVKKASEELGIQRAHIRRVISGDRKQWKGVVFKYAE